MDNSGVFSDMVRGSDINWWDCPGERSTAQMTGHVSLKHGHRVKDGFGKFETHYLFEILVVMLLAPNCASHAKSAGRTGQK